MPAPIDIAASGTMRLSEFALHAWDVAVAFDPAAAVAADAAPLLLGQMAHMFAWVAKPEHLDGKTATLEQEVLNVIARGLKIREAEEVPEPGTAFQDLRGGVTRR